MTTRTAETLPQLHAKVAGLRTRQKRQTSSGLVTQLILIQKDMR